MTVLLLGSSFKENWVCFWRVKSPHPWEAWTFWSQHPENNPWRKLKCKQTIKENIGELVKHFSAWWIMWKSWNCWQARKVESNFQPKDWRLIGANDPLAWVWTKFCNAVNNTPEFTGQSHSFKYLSHHLPTEWWCHGRKVLLNGFHLIHHTLGCYRQRTQKWRQHFLVAYKKVLAGI